MASLVLILNTATGQWQAGLVASGQMDAGSVLSGNIGSGQVGGTHIAAQALISANFGQFSVPGAALDPAPVFFGASGIGQLGRIRSSLLIDAGGDAFAAFTNNGARLFSGKLSVDASRQHPAFTTQLQAGSTSGDFFQGFDLSGTINFRLEGQSGLITTPSIISASLVSGLAHHIEAFITSTDTGGIWSTSWKAPFGATPIVIATPLLTSGIGSGKVNFASVLQVSRSNAAGGTYEPGALAGNVFAAGSGAVFVMAHDPTAP